MRNKNLKEELKAKIKDGWVICPLCFKKQFRVEEGTTIKNLRYRCKMSTAKSEHFMIVNTESEE